MTRWLLFLLASGCAGAECHEWERTEWAPEEPEEGCIGVLSRHGGAVIADKQACPYEQSCLLASPGDWARDSLAYYRTSDGPLAPTVVLVPECQASSCDDLDLILLGSRSGVE